MTNLKVQKSALNVKSLHNYLDDVYKNSKVVKTVYYYTSLN